MHELMAQRIWFLWRKELDGNRINKIPFAAGGGATGTNEKYRHTWVTYDDAMAAARKVGAAGVGFVIPEGYFFWISTMWIRLIRELILCSHVFAPMWNFLSAVMDFISMAR